MQLLLTIIVWTLFRFGMPEKPLYINIIRKPLDRLVSYYYFLRYGDDYRPHLVRHRAGDTMSFDECVKLKKPDCDVKNMWLQIPFFCGHHAECFEAGSEWALEEAKRNIVNEYFLVGMTEELGDFIEMLELSLPRLFQGKIAMINVLNLIIYYFQSSPLHRRYRTFPQVQQVPSKENKGKNWSSSNHGSQDKGVKNLDNGKRTLFLRSRSLLFHQE